LRFPPDAALLSEPSGGQPLPRRRIVLTVAGLLLAGVMPVFANRPPGTLWVPAFVTPAEGFSPTAHGMHQPARAHLLAVSVIQPGTCRVLFDLDNPCVSAQGIPLGECANGGVKSAYSASKMRAIAARTALEASYQALDRLTCAPGRQMTSAGSFDASGSGCPVGLSNL